MYTDNAYNTSNIIAVYKDQGLKLEASTLNPEFCYW